MILFGYNIMLFLGGDELEQSCIVNKTAKNVCDNKFFLGK